MSTGQSTKVEYNELSDHGQTQLSGRTIGYTIGYGQVKDPGLYFRIYDDVETGGNNYRACQVIVDYEMQGQHLGTKKVPMDSIHQPKKLNENIS